MEPPNLGREGLGGTQNYRQIANLWVSFVWRQQRGTLRVHVPNIVIEMLDI